MRPSRNLAALAVLGLFTVACGGPHNNDKTNSDGEFVVDGTLKYAVSQDPGNLDPSLTALSVTRQIGDFGYDTLLHTDAAGDLQAQLAEKWDTDGKTVTYVLREAITCSDGSPLTATDVAANYEFIADPKNESPLLGVSVPAGTKVSADDGTRTVTLSAPTQTPFLLESTADVLIVCRSGLDDRDKLAHQMAGTGPFVLDHVVANDVYVFTRRDDYAWGPDGADYDTTGVPKTAEVRVVTNATTATNLLLTGGLNIIYANGPEMARLDSQDLFRVDQESPLGLLWFNQEEGRPGADASVRQALTGVLVQSDVGKVMTGGRGVASRGLITASPRVCDADTASGFLPRMSADEANDLLDANGWVMGSDGTRAKDGVKLAFEFLLPAKFGDAGSAGATLVADLWRDLGAAVTITTQPDTALQEALFATGAWDAGFVPLTVSLPSQMVSFLSGPATPKGTNFAHLDNADYASEVEQASALTGDEACAHWAKAEEALISQADVAPLVNDRVSYFGRGVRFDGLAAGIDVRSVRLLAD